MRRTPLLVLILTACTPIGETDPGNDTDETDVEEDCESHATTAHWSYDGESGPDAWATLDTAYATCGSGTQQSPVDLPGALFENPDPALPDLEFRYEAATGVVLKNNGHTLEYEYTGENSGGMLRIGEVEYELVQFHFHAGSEHTLDGQQAPLEMHLVHKECRDVKAVVGVIILEGEANPNFPGWDALPTQADQEVEIEGAFNVAIALPTDTMAWRYSGSLTTPPCTEGVAWHVLAQTITMSTDQIAAFTAIYDHNYRPTPPRDTIDVVFGN